MSVCMLSAEELGIMAGISVKLGLQSLADACGMCEELSVSNCAAYAAQYNEFEPHHSADDIEQAALRALSTPGGLNGHFGPCVYNCVANDGTLYVGSLPVSGESLTGELLSTVKEWKRVEEACRKWADSESTHIARQAENDAAFSDVGPLPKLSADEIKSKMESAGGSRSIVAEFCVNESDSQSDYFGGRSARRVVIGFGTGSRESFVQMRKAAAMFPPTTDYAPGRDRFRVSLIWDHDHDSKNPRAFMSFANGWNCDQPRKGCGVPFTWYKDDYAGSLEYAHSGCFTFYTQAEADAFIATNHPKQGTEWRVNVDSYENRENYSMGGGNYLGAHRYSGWKVYMAQHVTECEFFDAPRPVETKRKRAAKPAVTSPMVSAETVCNLYAANV